MAQVLQFQRRFVRQPGWTQSELAEFYRVESALAQAGLHLETEEGVTDEGDPWFVFCRHDSGEIFIHFARIDGEFIIDGFGYERVARGDNFASLVRDLISSDLFALAKPKPKTGNIFLHPAALLIMLVGSAFLHSSEAKAADVHDRAEPRRFSGLLQILGKSASETLSSDFDTVQAAALVAGAVLATEPQALSIASPQAAFVPSVTDQAIGDVDVLSQASSVSQSPVKSVRAEASAVTLSTANAPIEHFAQSITASTVEPAAADISISLAPTEPLRMLVASAAIVTPALFNGPTNFDGVFLAAALPVALPADDAGALLQGLITQDHPVIALNGALSDLVVGLVKNGLHVAAAVAQATSTPSTATSGLPQAPAPTDAGGVAAEAPASTVVSAPATTAVYTPTSATAAPLSQPLFHDPVIDSAISQFISNAPHWEVLVSGRDLVVYDADIFGPHGAVPLDSVTFTFADGSSVSLVGTAAELAYAHGPH